MWKRYLWHTVVVGVTLALVFFATLDVAVPYVDAVRPWLPSDCALVALTAVVGGILYCLQTLLVGDE